MAKLTLDEAVQNCTDFKIPAGELKNCLKADNGLSSFEGKSNTSLSFRSFDKPSVISFFPIETYEKDAEANACEYVVLTKLTQRSTRESLLVKVYDQTRNAKIFINLGQFIRRPFDSMGASKPISLIGSLNETLADMSDDVARLRYLAGVDGNFRVTPISNPDFCGVAFDRATGQPTGKYAPTKFMKIEQI